MSMTYASNPFLQLVPVLSMPNFKAPLGTKAYIPSQGILLLKQTSRALEFATNRQTFNPWFEGPQCLHYNEKIDYLLLLPLQQSSKRRPMSRGGVMPFLTHQQGKWETLEVHGHPSRSESFRTSGYAHALCWPVLRLAH